jgi:hypothetical protein
MLLSATFLRGTRIITYELITYRAGGTKLKMKHFSNRVSLWV